MSGADARSNAAAEVAVSSAMVRAESDHLDATLNALVTRLASVPGLALTVSHRQGRLRRLIGDLPYINDLHRSGDPVREVVVAVGPCSYWLHSDHGAIRCGTEVTSLERGQVKEELAFSAWATALFDEIARQNLVNHDSLVALRRLVEQDRVD